MRAFTRALAALAILTTAAPANAESDFYLSLSGMYFVPTDSTVSTTVGDLKVESDLEMDSGMGFAAAIGYGAPIGLRGEIELSYRSADWDQLSGLKLSSGGQSVSFDVTAPVEGSTTATSLMANGYVTFEAWEQFRPYFGGGIGMAQIDASVDEQTYTVDGTDYTVPKASSDDTVVAYQIMLGVAYPLGDSAEARLGYRYFGTGEAEFDGFKAGLSSHNVEAGILLRF